MGTVKWVTWRKLGRYAVKMTEKSVAPNVITFSTLIEGYFYEEWLRKERNIIEV